MSMGQLILTPDRVPSRREASLGGPGAGPLRPWSWQTCQRRAAVCGMGRWTTPRCANEGSRRHLALPAAAALPPR
jgi:hypothetical protein